MRKRIDVESIEKAVDFDNVAQKLETLSESGALKRRNTLAALLDRIRPALLKARENRVPFTVLAQFLNENGIPVSEPTLRQYLNSLSDADPRPAKPRRKPAKEISKKPSKEQLAPDEPAALESAPVPPPAKASPPSAAPKLKVGKTLLPPPVSLTPTPEAQAHLEKMTSNASRKRRALFDESPPPPDKK